MMPPSLIEGVAITTGTGAVKVGEEAGVGDAGPAAAGAATGVTSKYFGGTCANTSTGRPAMETCGNKKFGFDTRVREATRFPSSTTGRNHMSNS